VEVNNLFPIPVCTTRLRPLYKKELDFVKDNQSKVEKNEGNYTSMDLNILDNPVMQDLKELLMAQVNEYFDQILCPQGDVEPYITLSWLNYTYKGGHHHRHAHGNSIVSGVLYVETTSEDKIWFYNSKHHSVNLTPKTWNLYNSLSWWIPAQQNSLIMFPSDLVHSVQPVETDTCRISLAFNVFVRGELGIKKSLNWLRLN
jgi:uncharacterized protein (TIGR02466 family)